MMLINYHSSVKYLWITFHKSENPELSTMYYQVILNIK